MKPRHLFAAVVLLGESVILAPFVVGWLVTGVLYGMVVAGRRARRGVRERLQQLRLGGHRAGSRRADVGGLRFA
jgi:hypothetical protein